MADSKQNQVQFKLLSKTPALAMDGHLVTTKLMVRVKLSFSSFKTRGWCIRGQWHCNT